MQKTLQKLKKENGATVIMALVYLLLCITIGGIILSSGSTAMGQVAKLQSEEQAYLAVFSAAELIRTEMQGISLTQEFITINHSQVCDVYEISPQTVITYPTNALADKLEEIYGDPAQEATFLVEADALGLADVLVKISMSADYVLKFVLTEQGDHLYTLTLLMPADVQTVHSTETLLHEFESSPGSGVFILCTRTYSSDTTIATFDVGTIYKGAN